MMDVISEFVAREAWVTSNICTEERAMNQPARTLPDPEPASPGPAPEHKVHYGRVDVAVWKREAEERTFYSFSISRSYKDKDDQWQRTSEPR